MKLTSLFKRQSDNSWLLENQDILTDSTRRTPEIFDGYKHAMENLLIEIKDVTYEAAVKGVDGLNNNIAWILGHIIYYNETRLLSEEMQSVQVKAWAKYFAPGTSPKDFDDDMPAFEELKEEIVSQKQRMTNICLKGNQKLLNNIETITYHMTMHIGQVKTIKLIVEN